MMAHKLRPLGLLIFFIFLPIKYGDVFPVCIFETIHFKKGNRKCCRKALFTIVNIGEGDKNEL